MSSRYVNVGTEIDGISYKGRYRVVRGMIAVKFLNNIKVVPLGEIEAKILAKMLLNELVGQSIFGQIFHLKSKKNNQVAVG